MGIAAKPWRVETSGTPSVSSQSCPAHRRLLKRQSQTGGGADQANAEPEHQAARPQVKRCEILTAELRHGG
jgi:hypothetical protein